MVYALGAVVSLAVVWVAPVVVGHSIGRRKGRQGAAFGFFLGWFGVLLLASRPSLYGDYGVVRCPSCGGSHSTKAKMCPHCQRDLTPLDAARELA